MEEKEIHKKFYEFAWNFLITNKPESLTEEDIKSYLEPEKCETINHVYYQMLFSAQNRVSSNNVIGGVIGGLENLGNLLGDFSPSYVYEQFKDDKELLKIIKEKFPQINIRNDEKSLWGQFSKSIISAAKFLKDFKDKNDFFECINRFYNDERVIDALPLLIEAKVFGFGIALACDFLKELGFVKFGKPDVHITEILKAYHFIDDIQNSDRGTLEIVKRIKEMADNANVTAYNFDKILWLIASGEYYKHKDKVKRKISLKSRFIDEAKNFYDSINK